MQQSVSRAEQEASCQALIERTTRMTDVTNGGVFRVDVMGAPIATTTGGPTGPPSSTDPTAVVSCRLTIAGTGHLLGTLVGIGNRPLPLT